MRQMNIWTALAVSSVVIAVVAGAIVAVVRFTDATFVLGVLPIAAAIIVAAFQYRAAKDNETDSRLFSQKQAAYTALLGLILGRFQKAGADSSDDEAALVKNLQTIRTELVIWGSSATLLTFDRMGSLPPDTSGLPVAGTRWMADLLGAIRKDLGHKDPQGAALEMALGILKEPDRTLLRNEIMKAGG